MNAQAQFSHYVDLVYVAYGKLAVRERILVAVTTAAALGYLWFLILGDGQLTRLDSEQRGINTLKTRLIAEEQRHQDLLRSVAIDPHAALHKELALLAQRIEADRAKLDELLERFVLPQRMPALLQEFLQGDSRLKLEKVGNVAVQEIEDAGLYRHSMSVELSGEFFEVITYLEALEASGWAFNWRSIDYRVERYPKAYIRLEIETLSSERSWIGV